MLPTRIFYNQLGYCFTIIVGKHPKTENFQSFQNILFFFAAVSKLVVSIMDTIVSKI